MIALGGPSPSRRRQQGLALLMMLVVLVLGAVYLLTVTMHAGRIQVEREAATAAALLQAKEALIAYALTYGEMHANKVPGYLLCPETGNSAITTPEGSADLSCGTKHTSAIGRFPWRTLGLEPLRDGSGECLWYAVSGSFKNNPAGDMMNWDTLGQLAIKGSDGASSIAGGSPESLAAAVVIAPGARLGRQDRSAVERTAICGGNLDPRNYLEASGGADNSTVSAIAGAISTFIVGGAVNGVNDRVLAITPGDIFGAIERRSDFYATVESFTQRVAACLAGYGRLNGAGPSDRRLPWPAPVALTDYSVDTNYDDSGETFSGRLPYRVNDSKGATANTMTQSNLITGVNCPGPWSALDDSWYKNWKDHLFYSLARSYSPGATAPSACTDCLSADGVGPFAAIVMFAGRRLAWQKRATPADKSSIANYLEERNSANHPNPAGNADYRSGPATTGFNDVLYCVDTSLTVAPCP